MVLVLFFVDFFMLMIWQNGVSSNILIATSMTLLLHLFFIVEAFYEMKEGTKKTFKKIKNKYISKPEKPAVNSSLSTLVLPELKEVEKNNEDFMKNISSSQLKEDSILNELHEFLQQPQSKNSQTTSSA